MGSSGYRYGGARALVLLHDRHLREFLGVWREARARGVELPRTDDPDYFTSDTLLLHVLGAARGYMTWICEQLDLPDPGIEPPPAAGEIALRAEEYMEHVLAGWRKPLVDVPEEKFEPAVYPARWGTPYCIDAMLEHAVMHPIRHTFQLRNLLSKAPE